MVVIANKKYFQTFPDFDVSYTSLFQALKIKYSKYIIERCNFAIGWVQFFMGEKIYLPDQDRVKIYLCGFKYLFIPHRQVFQLIQ